MNLSALQAVDAALDVLLRLISDRGLPALRTLFDDVRFKGKGHEVKAANVMNSARRVSYFILTPCVSCWSRRRTCDCSCRRWRTGPTGFTPNCSLKTSLTEWSDSARRRKSRWEAGDVWVLSLVFSAQHLCNCCFLQTCLKRIRLDMPLTHEDYTGTEPKLRHSFRQR